MLSLSIDKLRRQMNIYQAEADKADQQLAAMRIEATALKMKVKSSQELAATLRAIINREVKENTRNGTEKHTAGTTSGSDTSTPGADTGPGGGEPNDG